MQDLNERWRRSWTTSRKIPRGSSLICAPGMLYNISNKHKNGEGEEFMSKGPGSHRITEVDPDTRTATCSMCGPTTVRWKPSHQYWQCIVVYRKHHQRRARTRDEVLAARGIRCELCTFIPIDACQLQVHHIDGNFRNNIPSNLQLLCANCHMLITYRPDLITTRREEVNLHGRD